VVNQWRGERVFAASILSYTTRKCRAITNAGIAVGLPVSGRHVSRITRVSPLRQLAKWHNRRVIISLQQQYVFVATTKAASTTIERLLLPHAEICLHGEPKLKHMPLGKIHSVFAPLFGQSSLDLTDFVSFGVMREPTEWVISWFNYLSRPGLAKRNSARYVGEIDFDEFCSGLTLPMEQRPTWTIGGQLNRFALEGKLGINALVDHARIAAGFAQLTDLIGHDLSADLQTRRDNASRNVRLRIDDVTEAQQTTLSERFREDYELYAKVRQSPNGLYWANPVEREL